MCVQLVGAVVHPVDVYVSLLLELGHTGIGILGSETLTASHLEILKVLPSI